MSSHREDRSPRPSPAPSHYDTLGIRPSASESQIKQAYRRLVKTHHPDLNPDQTTGHDRMAAINGAYEVLSDVQQRQQYDRECCLGSVMGGASNASRADREATAQNRHRQRQAVERGEIELHSWLTRVQVPVDRWARELVKSLKGAIAELAADPFDDVLMSGFEEYLARSQVTLDKARTTLRSLPNPGSAAAVAAHLYYCLDRLSDGLHELAYYPLSYDDSRLHDGREMFRIAEGLRKEAQAAVRALKTRS